MQDGFYLANEKHRTVTGEIVEINSVLYFKLDKTGFDGKATKEHVKDYADQFGLFKKANPDYVLEDRLKEPDLIVGSPSVEAVAAPVVESSPVVDSIEESKAGKKRNRFE